MIQAGTAMLYILKDMSAVISLLVIMRFVFLEKIKVGKLKILVFSALVLLNAICGIFLLRNSTADYDSIMDFISNVIYIFALHFMTEQVGKGRILLTVFVYIYTVDMLYALVSSYTGSNLILEYSVNIAAFTLIGIAVPVLCARSRINFLPGVFAEIPLWVWLALLFFELTCYYKEFGVSASWYRTMYIVSVVGILLRLFYLLFKIAAMAFRQNQILSDLQRKTEFYEQRAAADEELRRFRHDYKNHMIVISALLAGGRTEEAAKYTETLGESVRTAAKKIRTGNPAADVLLNHKAAAAAENNIELHYTGYIPTNCFDDVDLCAVLSNLLDNAMEATAQCRSDRIIKIEADLVREQFLLTVSNPYVSLKKDRIGNLKTTKADPLNHGIGMKNVARIAEKYHGAVFTEQRYAVFTSNVRMRIRKTSNGSDIFI